MFDSTKEDLKDILKKVDEGKLQLPDFQRDYVWGDDDVQSLIASIAKGFPVGALLTLESGGEVAFKPRTLAGVERANPAPDELLLDGQQRMTSLYQAMYSKRPIRTRTQKKVEVERFYYLDIDKAASDAANIEEAIIGVPADRIIRTNFGRDIVLDLSKPEHEYENDLFPLNQVFDHTDWYAHHPPRQEEQSRGDLPCVREGQCRRQEARRLRVGYRHLRRIELRPSRGLERSPRTAWTYRSNDRC
jgi:hypothetical protein